VTIDRDENGVWNFEFPRFRGYISQGFKKLEAIENIQDLISACLQVRFEIGLALSMETRQIGLLALGVLA
jgi:predicted RNase H-like HicB family nuclease